MRAVIFPGPAKGAVRLPPSKSLGHRALLAAALAAGESRLSGAALSDDLQATLRAAQAFGAAARFLPDGCLLVQGAGFPAAPRGPVDCGESGSTLRFLVPLLALTGQPVTLTGRGRLLQRPQQIYEELFRARGLPFAAGQDWLQFCGPLPAGEYRLSGAVSSQFITGLLLALPLLEKDSSICIQPPFTSRPYVEMTLKVLEAFGVQARWTGPLTLAVPGGQSYRPHPLFPLEQDYSQAAFFAALGTLSGRVELTGLSPDSLQGDRVILAQLAQMGAPALPLAGKGLCFQTAPLRGGRFDLTDCPDLGPILTVLCSFAQGPSVIAGAGRLRLKESDRVAALQTELAKLGLPVFFAGDALQVPGRDSRPLPPPAETLDGWGDHRIVMALAVAATRAGGPVTIAGAEAVSKSYPRFFEDLQSLGVRVELC